MARGDSGRELGQNLRHSVGLARDLGANMGRAGVQMATAGAAAGMLAANIAKAAGATKGMAAGWIGIAAAIAATVAGVVSWRQETKDLAQSIAGIKRDMEIINADAAGDKRLARELQIQDAMEQQIETAKKNESFLRKMLSPQGYIDLLAAIQARGAAAIAAVDQEFKRLFQQRSLELFQEGKLTEAGFQRDDAVAKEAARQAARNATDAVDRGDFDTSSDKFGRAIGRTQLHARIQRNLENELELIDFQRFRSLGDQLGAGIAGAIADGIAFAVQTGDIGKGLRALAGGILIAIGQMMEEVGTRALLASELFTTLFAVLGTPAGIPAALALIAAGGVIKGLGQSLAGSGGGRSVAGSGYGGSGTRTVVVGTVYPSGSPSTAGITAVQPVVVNASFFGPRDPNLQRDFLQLMKLATARGAV